MRQTHHCRFVVTQCIPLDNLRLLVQCRGLTHSGSHEARDVRSENIRPCCEVFVPVDNSKLKFENLNFIFSVSRFNQINILACAPSTHARIFDNIIGITHIFLLLFWINEQICLIDRPHQISVLNIVGQVQSGAMGRQAEDSAVEATVEADARMAVQV